MTDYYPLIARAVAGQEKNTGEARRALYERARNALLAQLRSLDPPLSESEITRERLALEEAVRKVEAEAARQLRLDVQRGRSAPPPKVAEPAPIPESPRQPGPHPQPPREPEPVRPPAPRLPDAVPRASNGAPKPPGPVTRPPTARAERPVSPPPGRQPEPQSPVPAAASPPSPPRTPPANERPPSGPGGLKGIRDVVAEAESLGGAAAQASKSAREAFARVPGGSPEFDRVEPRVEPGEQRPSGPVSPDAAAPRPLRPAESAGAPLLPPAPPLPGARDPEPRRPRPLARPAIELEDEHARRSRKGMIAAVTALLVLALLAGGAYWQRERISVWFGSVRGTAQQAQRDTSPARPKIADRVGQEGQQPATQPGQTPSGPSAARPTAPAAAVAQRVVLYEEDPSNPDGQRHVGSAIWRTETVSAGPGLAPELAIRADVEVPERRLAMTFSLRRNTDPALPASHTIEIMFNLPADFPFGGVANVPGILMKESEQARGAPLSGLAVKVTNNFFLIGLSAAEVDLQRNLQLLKERPWFDIPIVYNNGRRAILAIEKGNPGERVFNEAFAAWGR